MQAKRRRRGAPVAKKGRKAERGTGTGYGMDAFDVEVGVECSSFEGDNEIESRVFFEVVGEDWGWIRYVGRGGEY